jgi:hypothetical protein
VAVVHKPGGDAFRQQSHRNRQAPEPFPHPKALPASEFINIEQLRAAGSVRRRTGFLGGQFRRLWISGAKLREVEYEGRSYVVFKNILAGATALALVIAPEVALAQSSATPRAAITEVAPAVEAVEGDSELLQERRRRRGFLIPLFATILVGLGIYIWLIDDNEGPGVSPG